MKRKLLVTILSLIMGLSIVACGKQETTATTEPIVESTQVETTEVTAEQVESTEAIEDNTTENETEAVEESTETVESTEVADTTDIENGEPLSEKDLAFSFLGYDTYNEYVEAGNTYSAIMAYEEDIEDEDEVDVSINSTVRGIKIGDSIDKVFELYDPADKYDKYGKGDFSHDGLEDVDRYMYFFTVDSTKDYFYSFSFVTDQYSDVIGLIIEPISMKYWTGNKAQ